MRVILHVCFILVLFVFFVVRRVFRRLCHCANYDVKIRRSITANGNAIAGRRGLRGLNVSINIRFVVIPPP